jgi:hypothetical protein
MLYMGKDKFENEVGAPVLPAAVSLRHAPISVRQVLA